MGQEEEDVGEDVAGGREASGQAELSDDRE